MGIAEELLDPDFDMTAAVAAHSGVNHALAEFALHCFALSESDAVLRLPYTDAAVVGVASLSMDSDEFLAFLNEFHVSVVRIADVALVQRHSPIFKMSRPIAVLRGCG